MTVKDLDLGRELAGRRHRQRRLARRAPGPDDRAARRAGGRRPQRSWTPQPMRVEPPVPAEALAAIRAPVRRAPARSPSTPPMLQPLSLLLDLAGEAMRARLFVVQAEGGAEACLRPDFTIAVAAPHIDERRGGRAATSTRARPSASRREGPSAPRSSCSSALEPFARRRRRRRGRRRDRRPGLARGRGRRARGPDAVAGRRRPVRGLHRRPWACPRPLAARLKRVAGRPRLLNAELARAGEAAPAGRAGGRLAAHARRPARGRGRRRAGGALGAGRHRAGRRPRRRRDRRIAWPRRAEAAARARRLTAAQAALIRALHGHLRGARRPAWTQVARPGRQGGRKLDGRAGRLGRAAGGAGGRRRAGARCASPPAFGRAFGYYDGLLSRCAARRSGADRPVAAGGRYDSLLARLGGAAGARRGRLHGAARRGPAREARHERAP